MKRTKLRHLRGVRRQLDPKPDRPTLDDDVKEVQRQTKQIHNLETERRKLRKRLTEIAKELKARRRGLKLFLIASATRTSAAVREEFASSLPDPAEAEIAREEARIEDGQARWGATGSSRK